jgi:PAS domain S-box
MKKKISRLSCLLLVVVIVGGLLSSCVSDSQDEPSVSNQPEAPIIENYKEIPGITEQEIDAIESFKEKGRHFKYVSVLTTEVYEKSDGTYYGFTVSFSELLSNLFDIPFDYSVLEWDDLINGLNDKKYDFTGELTPTPERKKQYSMTLPIVERGLTAFSLAGADRIINEDDINGKRIGFLEGTITAQSIMENYPSLNFVSVEVSGTQDAIERLQEGTIDAFVDETPSAVVFAGPDFQRSKELFDMVYTPISLTTANPELAPIISVVDKYILAGGINKIHELYIAGKKEYNEYAFNASLTKEEFEYLSNHIGTNSKVPVALENELYPISFYNIQNSEYQGIAPDVLKEISELTGIEFEIVTDQSSSWSQIIEKLESGDAALVSELLYTEEREGRFLFSEYPYATCRYALLSKMDFPNLETYQISYAKIGVVIDTAPTEVFESYFPNHPNVVYYQYHSDAYDALEKGDVDLMMASEYQLLDFINYHEKPGYKINRYMSMPIYESYFGFNIDEVYLHSIFNKAMRHVDLSFIEKAWISRSFDYEKALATERERSANQRFVTISLFAAVLLGALIVLLIFITRDVRKRKVIENQTSVINAIYNSFPDSVFTKDMDGRYTSANKSALLFAGKDIKDFIGKTASELFPENISMAEDFCVSDETVVRDNEVTRTEVWREYSDGSRRLFEDIKTPLINKGKIIGLLGFMRDITEHNELLEKTKYQSQYELVKYSLTSKALNIVHFDMEVLDDTLISAASKIVWSDEFKQMLGFDIEDEFPSVLESVTGRLHPEDRDRVLDALRSHLDDITGKTMCDVQCRILVKNGTYRYFRLVVGTLRDETGAPKRIAGAMEDINEKKRIQEELDEASRAAEEQRKFVIEEHKRLQTILDMLPIGVRIMRTSDGVLLYANEATVRIFNGKSFEDQAMGMSSNKFMPEFQPDGRKSIDVFKEYIHDAASSIEVQCLRIDGEPFLARFTTCRINYQGELCSLGVVEDVTAEREHQKRLQEIAKKESEANQAKSEFLAKMSHEIRTPMNAIIGMSELALREYMSDAAYEQVFTVKQAGSHLLALINDILDFSKIETGKMKIIATEYSFSSLANDVISIIRMRLFGSKNRFTVNIGSNIPNTLLGDVTRVRQVLINIIGNAVKYTDKGFVSLTVQGDIVDDDTVILSMEVKDSGRGIKKEDITKLFGEYMQVDTEKNQGLEGVGLGLAISLSLIKAMEGDISVESEYGVGSTFTITLPQKIKLPDRIAVVENVENKRVIICDRRKIYSDSIEKTLNDLGVQYELVTSESDLCRKISAESYPFIFVSYALFKKSKEEILNAAGNSRIVLLVDFGEAIPEGNWSVIVMPAHAISITNVLNGIPEDYSYNVNADSTVQFVAPDTKVLIVDDINTNLKVAEGMMKPYEMNIDLCRSGEEAIVAVKETEYDIVFMDHRMPGMDGVEATKYIRALGAEDPRFTSLPIIALTANAVSGMREMFLASGFDDYLSKPIETSKLNGVLDKWIKSKHKKVKTDTAQSMQSELSHDINIEGLDVEKGLLHTGGTIDLFMETLRVFCDDGSEKSKMIQDCLDSGDISTYTVHVHAMKSAAANIGASDVSEAAKNLEMAGVRGDMNFIETHNEDFLKSLNNLLDNIKSVFPSTIEEKQVDNASFRNDLVKLKIAIENMDPRSIKISLENAKKVAPEQYVDDIKNIARNVLMSEYDEAVELIGTIIQNKE